jgi:hypothetical protein
MGITAVGTTLMLILAYVAQSPRLLKRLGLSGYRLDLRARTLTGYALALLLLSAGFFLAGVPLGTFSDDVAAEATQPVSDTNGSDAMGVVAGPVSTTVPEASAVATIADDGTPDSGAFAGPPPSAMTETTEAFSDVNGQDETFTPEAATEVVVLPSPTFTPTNTVTPSPTPSPTPTNTPTPTQTPTPIFEETAMINTGSSTVWIKRTPGGQDYVLIRGGDTVILFPGHANIGGSMWREVSTVEGIAGWVLESYLSSGEESVTGGEGG